MRSELGPDAVILDHRKVVSPDGGYAFEVRAATDTTDDNPHGSHSSLLHHNCEEGKLLKEIEEIKDFLSLLVSTKSTFAHLQRHRVLADVYHYLLMQDLDEKKIYLLLTRAVKTLNGNLEDKNRLIAAFCQQLLGQIRVVQPLQNLEKGRDDTPAMWTFIGPTGAGKTTTLVKLAARLSRDYHLKVGVISLDTYRVGAYDQIKAYTDIIGLPLMIAQSTDEVEFARRQLRDRDVLLVDTMGRNFFKEKHVNELLKCFEGIKEVRHFLVMSATTKDRDLLKIIPVFGVFKPYGTIFTKLDETTTYGNVVNQLLRYPYPAAFLSAGQRVPEDIEEATKRHIMRLLFPATQRKLPDKGDA